MSPLLLLAIAWLLLRKVSGSKGGQSGTMPAKTILKSVPTISVHEQGTKPGKATAVRVSVIRAASERWQGTPDGEGFGTDNSPPESYMMWLTQKLTANPLTPRTIYYTPGGSRAIPDEPNGPQDRAAMFVPFEVQSGRDTVHTQQWQFWAKPSSNALKTIAPPGEELADRL